jgi:hypothetical protein
VASKVTAQYPAISAEQIMLPRQITLLEAESTMKQQ